MFKDYTSISEWLASEPAATITHDGITYAEYTSEDKYIIKWFETISKSAAEYIESELDEEYGIDDIESNSQELDETGLQIVDYIQQVNKNRGITSDIELDTFEYIDDNEARELGDKIKELPILTQISLTQKAISYASDKPDRTQAIRNALLYLYNKETKN